MTDSKEKNKSTKLTRFIINELNDEFNYSIPLNQYSHLTAIIAPNGNGKTLCLRLIHALFNEKWFFFKEIAFKDIIYEFSCGAIIKIIKNQKTKNKDEFNEDNIHSEITINLIKENNTPIKYQPEISLRKMKRIIHPALIDLGNLE